MTELTTKEKILMTAKTLFVEHGFAGTSISAIAKAAAINHSLIFHHFGNKEGLWLAVKQAIVDNASQHQSLIPSTALPLEEFLREGFERWADFYKNNPDIRRLLFWQQLEGKSKRKIGIALTRNAQQWIAAFKDYQHRQLINPQLRPEFIMTLFFSTINHAIFHPNVFIDDEKDWQAYKNFCIASLMRAISYPL